MSEEKRVLHCWKDKGEYVEETYGYLSEEYVENFAEECLDDGGHGGSTCMLPDGHEGPHVWTPDGDIRVSFKR